MATEPPVTAPQMPNAAPRSRPWNSWPIRASAVANIIAAPAPCTPRERLSIVGVVESPQTSEAAVKTPRPAFGKIGRPHDDPDQRSTGRVPEDMTVRRAAL